MKTGHKPMPPRSALGAFIPETMDVEDVKKHGWIDHRILVVRADDARIGWIERQVIEQLGEKLYGRKANRV